MCTRGIVHGSRKQLKGGRQKKKESTFQFSVGKCRVYRGKECNLETHNVVENVRAAKRGCYKRAGSVVSPYLVAIIVKRNSFQRGRHIIARVNCDKFLTLSARRSLIVSTLSRDMHAEEPIDPVINYARACRVVPVGLSSRGDFSLLTHTHTQRKSSRTMSHSSNKRSTKEIR